MLHAAVNAPPTQEGQPIVNGRGADPRPPGWRYRAGRDVVLFSTFLALAAFIEATPERATLFGVEGPSCPSEWIGLRCPGCGLTRASALTMDAEITAATRVQPAGLLLVALAAIGILVNVAALLREPGRWFDRSLALGRTAFVTGVMATWILRIL